MIFWTLLVFLGPYLLYMAFAIYREICCISRMKKYEKKGFKKFYSPFFGNLSLNAPDTDSSRDILDSFKSVMHNASLTDHGVVANNTWKKTATVYLTDLQMVRDFFSKEHEFTARIPFSPIPWGTSFAFTAKSNESAVTRGLVLKLFGKEGVKKELKRLVEFTEKIVGAFGDQQQAECEVDMVAECSFFVRKLYQLMMIGEGTNNVRIYGGKVKLFDGLQFALTTVYSDKGFYHPANIFLGGLPAKMGLLSGLNQSRNIAAETLRAVEKLHEERMISSDYKPSRNLVDLVILHNDKRPDEKVALEDLHATMMDCLSLGFSSMSTFLAIVCFIASSVEKERAKLLQDIALLEGKELTVERVEELKQLDCFVKECLRKYSPYYVSEERVVLKEMKIGECSFAPGDIVQVPFTHFMHSDKLAREPTTFDPSTFADPQAATNQNYFPFSLGPRSCPAGYFSEFMVKLFLVAFLRKNEVSMTNRLIANVMLSTKGLHQIKQLKVTIKRVSPAE